MWKKAAKPSLLNGWQNKIIDFNKVKESSTFTRSDSEDKIMSCCNPDELKSANDTTGMENTNKSPLIHDILQNNKNWSNRIKEKVPGFFETLAKQQNPEILWIGCSDSRVPANQIIDLPPGEVFVHRNIANVFNHTDFNALSVLQFAVEVLKVKHVIVCGHYGCGGVAASIDSKQLGLIDNWLRNIKDVYFQNYDRLQEYSQQFPESERDQKIRDKMTELNVARSVKNVCATTVLQNAWANGQNVSVHGWCYRLSDGIINDLDISISSVEELAKVYQMKYSK